MELRLLHYWMSRPAQDGWRTIWAVAVPHLALDHPNLFSAVFAFAATQLSALYPEDEDLVAARKAYWTQALREQRILLADLSNVDRQAMTLSGHLISVNAFAMLRGRVLQPYAPPLEWFETARGAMLVTPKGEARNALGHDSPLRKLFEYMGPVRALREVLDGQSNDQGIGPEYQRYMDPFVDPAHPLTVETSRVYEKVLRLISAFRSSIRQGESAPSGMRFVSYFPYHIPAFADLLREGEPRALVILACFFAMVAQSDVGRLFGDPTRSIPMREVSAINAVLPERWKKLMERPMEDTFGSMTLAPNPSPMSEVDGSHWDTVYRNAT